MPSQSASRYPELDDDRCWACLIRIEGEPIRTCNTTVCSEGCREAAEEAMEPIAGETPCQSERRFSACLVDANLALASQIQLDRPGRLGGHIKRPGGAMNTPGPAPDLEVQMPEDRTASAEPRVYYFNAYVRVEAASEDAAWERISTEPVIVSEADGSDPEHEEDVNLVVLDLLDHEPVDTGPVCVCPPDLVARGGFKGECRAWTHV